MEIMRDRRYSGLPLDLSVRDDSDPESQTISGFAAVYYREDDPGTEYEIWPGVTERIMPGTFDAPNGERQRKIVGLWNHDPNHVLGSEAAGTMVVRSEARGLFYEIDAPDTQMGRDVVVGIRRGDIRGSSFSFMALDEDWVDMGDDQAVRVVKRAEVWDVGPTIFPAYDSTTADLRRSGGHLTAARSSHSEWIGRRLWIDDARRRLTYARLVT